MAQGVVRDSAEAPRADDADDRKAGAKAARCGSDGRAMGSRRIFAPQFKLQVLDSYRQDADCRGNQRATARKYGIHRRQIQKWLQAEASLRTSVEAGAAPAALNLCTEPSTRQRDDEAAATAAAVEPAPRSSSDSELDDEDEYDEDDMDDPMPDQALDFTCAALSKRRSFSLQFKLEVVDAFHSDGACHGNQRATARKFGINRRQVQKWLGQEEELRGEAAFRGGLHRQRLGRWPDGERDEDYVNVVDTVSDGYDSDQCWDLSCKKRKLEDDDSSYFNVETKRRAIEPLRRLDINENMRVPSVEKPPPYSPLADVQETALCLVKTEKQEELTPERKRSPSPADLTRYTQRGDVISHTPPDTHPHMLPFLLHPPPPTTCFPAPVDYGTVPMLAFYHSYISEYKPLCPLDCCADYCGGPCTITTKFGIHHDLAPAWVKEESKIFHEFSPVARSFDLYR